MRRTVRSVRQFQSLLQHQRDCFSGFARRPNCLVDYNRLYAYRPTIDVAIDRYSYPSFIISRALSIDAAQVTTGDVNRGGPLVEYERRIAAGELVDGDICQERCVVHEIGLATDYRKLTSPEGLATYNIVIQYALSMISGESVWLYVARSDRVLTLVDKYFEMPRLKAVKALEIYRKAENQAPALFIQTMEEYVNEVPRALTWNEVRDDSVSGMDYENKYDHFKKKKIKKKDDDVDEKSDPPATSPESPKNEQSEAAVTYQVADLLIHPSQS